MFRMKVSSGRWGVRRSQYKPGRTTVTSLTEAMSPPESLPSGNHRERVRHCLFLCAGNLTTRPIRNAALDILRAAEDVRTTVPTVTSRAHASSAMSRLHSPKVNSV
jgi:hypothetical protein